MANSEGPLGMLITVRLNSHAIDCQHTVQGNKMNKLNLGKRISGNVMHMAAGIPKQLGNGEDLITK